MFLAEYGKILHKREKEKLLGLQAGFRGNTEYPRFTSLESKLQLKKGHCPKAF